MKINLKKQKDALCRVQDVDIGDTFLDNGVLYLKVWSKTFKLNAVELHSGFCLEYDPGYIVTPVTAEVTCYH